MLEHTKERCTGNWRLVGLGENRRLKCEQCQASNEPTRDNRIKAIDENELGRYLKRLADEGLEQKERQKRGDFGHSNFDYE